jgi:hypothetical protein
VFLHPLSTRVLLEEHGGYLALPHAVAGTVVELEPATQSEELRRRHRALEHLPLSSELRFAEIDVAPLVSRRAAQLFAGKVREREAARRARRRREDAARARVEREERRRPLPTALPTVHPSVASSPPPSLLFSLPCPLL